MTTYTWQAQVIVKEFRPEPPSLRVMRRVEPSRRLMDASRPLHDPVFPYTPSDFTNIQGSFADERQRLADQAADQPQRESD